MCLALSKYLLILIRIFSRHATKGILVLIPILGLPWLIGYFLLIFNYQVDIAFQYAHVIMNGLQGVTIFILYCGLNQEVYKKNIKLIFCKSMTLIFAQN